MEHTRASGRMRRVLAGLAGLVVVAGLVVKWSCKAAEPQAPIRGVAVSPAGMEQLAVGTNAADGPSSNSTRVAPHDGPPTSTAVSTELHVVKRDAQGRLQPYPCRVVFRREPGGPSSRVDTRTVAAPGGNAALELPDGAWVVHAVQGAAEVPAIVSADELRPGLREATIVVERRSTWTLDVVSDETGEPLADYAVLQWKPAKPDPLRTAMLVHEHRRSLPPQGAETLVERAAGPLVFPDETAGTFWAKADGLETRLFERDPMQAQVRVRLRRTGSLQVEVAPSMSREVDLVSSLEVDPSYYPSYRGKLPPYELRVYSAEELLPAARTRVAPGAKLDLQGLVPGRYFARLGMWSEQAPLCLVHESSIDLAAGEDRQLLLEGDAEAAYSGRGRLHLEIKGCGSLPVQAVQATLLRKQDAGTELVFSETIEHWRMAKGSGTRIAPFLPHGDYVLRLSSPPLEATARLVGVEAHLVLDATQATKLEVKVTGADAAKGAIQLWWRRDGEEQMRAGPTMEQGRSSLVLRCTPGRLRLRLHAPGAASEEVEHEVVAGSTAGVELALKPSAACELRLSLWSGAARAQCTAADWSRIQVRRLDGQGGLVTLRLGSLDTLLPGRDGVVRPDPGQPVLVLAGPGRHAVACPGLFDEFELDVPAGLSDHAVIAAP